MSPLNHPPLILASSSPRRHELLAAAGYRFEIDPPDDAVEDIGGSAFSPRELVAELARRKAADVRPRWPDRLILACDTVAECDGEVLGKPADVNDARRMLLTLSGKEHSVLSGLCLWPAKAPAPLVEVDQTMLRMDSLTEQVIEAYLASGDWQGKAGAIGFQDDLGWLRVTSGSQSNVVGLPMELLERMLASSSKT